MPRAIFTFYFTMWYTDGGLIPDAGTVHVGLLRSEKTGKTREDIDDLHGLPACLGLAGDV